MLTIGKMVLSLVLLACTAAMPLACVNINRPPSDDPKTEVNVGGERGVNVERQRETKVEVEVDD